MADMQVYGVFQEVTGLGASGEPYDTSVEAKIPERHRGKQLIIRHLGAVTGRGRDAWLDRSLPLAGPPGEPFEDPLPLEATLTPSRRRGPGPGAVTDKPFRPANSPAKSGRASGHLYGTFGPRELLLETDGTGIQRPPPEPGPPLRNFATTSPKRCGPGYPDQARLMSGGCYPYVPDEYERGRVLEKRLKRDARSRIPAPFLGGARPKGVFTSDAELYGRPPPAPPRAASACEPRPAWRPNSPPARGRHCGLLSREQYIPAPETDFKFKLRDARAARPFVPTSAGHKRLSMWSVNPYERAARPPADPDGTALL